MREKLKELSLQKEQVMAQLNAIMGAEQVILSLLDGGEDVKSDDDKRKQPYSYNGNSVSCDGIFLLAPEALYRQAGKAA